jgi:glycine cleavage system H protein
MDTPTDRKYSKEHEWVLVRGDGIALVGISFFAQDSLGDVVYVDLPNVGAQVEQSKQMGELESVKAVSDLFSPVTGEVVEVNQAVVDAPQLLNSDPYVTGWLVKVRVADTAQLDALLDSSQYDGFTTQA